MEKIIKEGKEVDVILDEILSESNLTKDEIIYTVNDKKGKLFQGNLKEVTVYKKETINNEIKNYLKEIIENMGLEVKFELSTKDERTTIKMYSNNNPILIGKNGQTLKALETLAIIAYNPCITRAEIETIRGVNSDGTMYKLLDYNLIEEAGKLDAPGKPMTYKTSKEFLKMFGISSLSELPPLPKYKLDENRQIVIDEIIGG